MTTAYVGLGSNVGDRMDHLRAAVKTLRDHPQVQVRRSSSVYETEPVGPPQGLFLNAVVEIETSLGPRELLTLSKSIEHELGRTPSERWGPREIDLDILLYGEEQIDEPDLVIPHPEMHHRAFVLAPLRELGLEIGDIDDARVRRIHDPL